MSTTRRMIGDTFSYVFTIRDENLALHNPSIVTVSFLKGDGSEDVLTLGGVAAHDSWLTHTGLGTYAVNYVLDVLGEWRINERWTDDNWIHPIKGVPMFITVDADPQHYVDTPAP